MGRKDREVRETKKEDLVVRLTEDEKNERARKLSIKLGELERHKDDCRRIQSDHSARTKALEAEIKKLGECVREGSETRPVDVEVIADYARGVVEEVRTDTGEKIADRAMRQDERQIDLPGASAAELVSLATPKSVARKLFSEGARPEDVGLEKVVEEAAAAAGVERVAVLDALVEIAEEALARKGERDAETEAGAETKSEEKPEGVAPF